MNRKDLGDVSTIIADKQKAIDGQALKALLSEVEALNILGQALKKHRLPEKKTTFKRIIVHLNSVHGDGEFNIEEIRKKSPDSQSISIIDTIKNIELRANADTKVIASIYCGHDKNYSPLFVKITVDAGRQNLCLGPENYFAIKEINDIDSSNKERYLELIKKTINSLTQEVLGQMKESLSEMAEQLADSFADAYKQVRIIEREALLK